MTQCNIVEHIIKDEIKKYRENYSNRLSYHCKLSAISLVDDTEELRRVKSYT